MRNTKNPFQAIMPAASEWINGIEPSSISQHFLPAIHILAKNTTSLTFFPYLPHVNLSSILFKDPNILKIICSLNINKAHRFGDVPIKNNIKNICQYVVWLLLGFVFVKFFLCFFRLNFIHDDMVTWFLVVTLYWCTYNHVHNIFKLFDGWVNFSFPRSERKYHY